MENGYVESFNGRLRDECLNENWFCSLAEARETIEAWRQDYNQCRPHSALSYRTPEEFAKTTRGDCGKDGGGTALENAARFPLSHSLDGCGPQLGSAMLETQNLENVSLSLDSGLKMGGRSAAEVLQLPAPDFRSGYHSTVVTTFGPMDFDEMGREDRIRACYQHCALKYVMSKK